MLIEKHQDTNSPKKFPMVLEAINLYLKHIIYGKLHKNTSCNDGLCRLMTPTIVSPCYAPHWQEKNADCWVQWFFLSTANDSYRMLNGVFFISEVLVIWEKRGWEWLHSNYIRIQKNRKTFSLHNTNSKSLYTHAMWTYTFSKQTLGLTNIEKRQPEFFLQDANAQASQLRLFISHHIHKNVPTEQQYFFSFK